MGFTLLKFAARERVKTLRGKQTVGTLPQRCSPEELEIVTSQRALIALATVTTAARAAGGTVSE
jgi:hypothetical protein